MRRTRRDVAARSGASPVSVAALGEVLAEDNYRMPFRRSRENIVTVKADIAERGIAQGRDLAIVAPLLCVAHQPFDTWKLLERMRETGEGPGSCVVSYGIRAFNGL